MFGGIDPKKMQAMMKQMGIKQDEIDASRVVIEKNDGSNIIIENPSVVKVTMQGQQTFQISGDISEQAQGVSEEDVRLIMEKTGKDFDEAKATLEKNDGDIAQTIVDLS